MVHISKENADGLECVLHHRVCMSREECPGCGWEKHEAASRIERIKNDELVKCEDGLYRLLVKRGKQQ